MKGGQDWSWVEEERFEVAAVTLFGKIVMARYATLEQAEWRARELVKRQNAIRAATSSTWRGQRKGRPGNDNWASAEGIVNSNPDRAAKPALLS
ncbi:MAG TPA: hypothetical protein VE691_14285 [Rubrobacter sp.]|jgi:hypothetical protein|nr:hypothetical protein [Rubrobacter sp.]